MGMHGKPKRDNRLFNWISSKWNGLSRMDKVINGTIAATIGVIVVACLIFFLPEHFNNTKQEAVISSSKVSSKKEKKSDKESSKKDSVSDVSKDNDSTYEENDYGTSRNENTNISKNETNASTSNDNSSAKNGKRDLGEVVDGMNGEYRMAARAGIVKGSGDPSEVQDFYENVQENTDENGNGSFTYNGQTVYTQVTRPWTNDQHGAFNVYVDQ